MIRLLHAEWTKFRTVRGWVAGLVVAALVTVGLGLFSASGSHSSCDQDCAVTPVGPGGEAVIDHFFFAHRELVGDGSITARVNAMTGTIRLPDITPGVRRTAPGLVPWAKAGVMIKESTRQGSSYAAMMLTGGHGVRMQYDYTHDIPGKIAGPWVRLTRAGDLVTGYASADGRRWTAVGTTRLAGNARIGLFAASPGALTVTQGDFGGSIGAIRFTETRAVFDQISPQGSWKYDDIGASVNANGSIHHPGGASQSGGTLKITGVGDIGPSLDGMRVENTLTGLLAALLVVAVVAVLFVGSEYRRGLLRLSLLASPRRGRVLVAKAAVVFAVTFAAGLASAAVVVPVGVGILRSNGNYVLPVSALTSVRVVAGVAVMLALAAVFALALGALLRRSAVAVTAAIALIVVPHLLATSSVLPPEVARWLLRLTPAAGFAIQQSIPAYDQVIDNYTAQAGYYPLAPWAGLAVLCGYAVLALGLAVVRLNRRDA